ncbi:hypothetical protein CHS0354_016342 [Potamilus streckersoni]|uniref:Sushi domain-containing protein n=1 Tax=Potamilus streckersoni TaxID=2493646 RepID=A0AAE0VZ83_9BIVA|nr:hypothetical protein CHS0354_016342 [Potamilus streckersoni]
MSFRGKETKSKSEIKFMAGSISGCPDIRKLWNQNSSSHDSGSNSDVIIIHSEDGQFVHVLCPNDLHLIGPASVTCLKSGQWSDTTRPYCTTSSPNGVPQSTLLLIGILAGCAALVLISVAVIIVSIVCMKRKNQTPSSSSEYLRQSLESIASTKYHVDVNNATKTASAATNSPKDRTTQTESDTNVFPNRAFQPTETREYDQPWGHKPPVVDPPQKGTGLFPSLANTKEYRTPF